MAENENIEGQDPSIKAGKTGFSQEYVQELRQEAAHWRTKSRDLEGKLSEYTRAEEEYKIVSTISEELKSKGIEGVEPHWVELSDGQTPSQAVDAFLKKHPKFASEQTEPQQRRSATPKPTGTDQGNSNVSREINPEYSQLKKDPVARERLRSQYRDLIARSGHGSTQR